MATPMSFTALREHVKAFKNKGLNRIYLHWSAGHYNNIEDAYHISIDGTGKVYLMHPLTTRLAATWRRNSNSIAVSMMCCPDAVAYSRRNIDYGSEPPTMKQIEAMAKVVCILCEELDLDMSYPTVMTHAEAADIDGYGIDDSDPDMRWDLVTLEDSDGIYKDGGDVIRGKAVWYKYHKEDI